MANKAKTPKKGGLGKGLNSLLGFEDNVELDLSSNNNKQEREAANLIEVPVDSIRPNPRQPRKVFNQVELEELSRSLKEDGVVQPLIVSKTDGGYTLIAGERRWRASKLAGFSQVPVLVKSVSPDEMLRIAIIENVQRSNLNVIEEAEAYATLIKDFGLTQEECAKKVGKDRVTVTNLLRILALPREVQDDLMEGTLSMGHGRAMLGLSEKKLILRARDIIVKKKLSVRQTEQLVKKFKKQGEEPIADPEADDPNLEYLAESLRSFLRTKVRVAGNGSRGRIEISYFSAAELERLLRSIGGPQFDS
ncbi:ParB/RepB/Spo0J family partition protein [Pseudobacteriovorax antillogorgiicola]|uniref:Chromosome partitioning protein, ParB family n=1 Tax=Pseudobacteriovorax antillogorgiicola TaxID=1513793 RepID=A0A1Y6B8L1_9BACT|nr:ParB/RepB/Spo0J family partition protein [Pseudobacteriovorax antillogorgiicola]TCS59152.1 ParB family chromosome partitioning protein [Pseudobacteriovorax antillogorgiicola]SME91166.1 chromosome partitioning protein, ParB family [Pseudobacteriovorax antillogorgiicola]